ncbi:ribulose-5-phosphate 4-epimerase/fuculose-1-phosphate aldolase [Bradyrhizobium sp. USDA 4524]|uniref:class II aldolase/adducin family protein n=1 Tax=unclassified Bradyrhizobium TaxID=2631580 RepID=UPI00209DDD1E|nr:MULTISPECIES: class II aldolase/adducin family protein [unclassified Bradyrhizobium]MCP1838574.1 ribulose-5-phosphate 4-epimerase/fuculose-1-phosphate aldolase [Bradyrhizobium sp. USDA 4538]MCP1899139.1 ribulose-5-phosphate 4-epimerase/fuculose-1-phosphate aldolase [Bradyrhizobium sp. USDA 4537]MCP1986748.1 ribulose-5-phosphate 4-epimerase/fuculose-1-phosphate aldolase [Bradyrhizobium sp. USDA 4539]
MSMYEPKTERSQFSQAEWDQRVDMAAAHRLAHLQGFSEGIFNHLTAIVPDHPDQYLCLPFGMHWSEATASCFLSVDFNKRVIKGRGEVERSSYGIHVPIHRMRPDAPYVFHIHAPYASALTRLEDSRLLPIGQTEASFIHDIAYDVRYSGFGSTPGEGDRLGKVLGGKSILFMGNHGIVVLGRTVGEAYDRMYYLERACQTQLYAMWTGKKLRPISDEIALKMGAPLNYKELKYGGRAHFDLHFDALKRLLSGEPKTRFDE